MYLDVLIISAVSTASWCDVSANSREKAESHALAGLKVIEISPATSKVPTRSVHSL